MTLINTDGMALFGPGSEWFWTAMTGVVLAATFIAIYRQLRIQAHASAIEQLDSFSREAGAEWAQQATVDILVALRDGKDPADVPESAARQLMEYWEMFATLVRAGHLDAKLFWQLDPEAAQVAWGWLAPWTKKRRAESGMYDMGSNLEWLAELTAQLDRRAGRPAVPPGFVRDINREITYRQERIRTARALRTVILAPTEAAKLSSSPQRLHASVRPSASSPDMR